MKKITALLPALLLAVLVHAQGIAGTWKTIDDETGEAKSYIELYEQNGTLQSKVARLLRKGPDTKCEKCTGDRHNQLVLGMNVLENMKLKDGYYQSGRILDPEKGKWYSCKMWLKDGDPNTLVVRGSIGPFYRTQYWHRVQ
jgi:uncharacterized protein (DUF2147 family)